MAGKPRVAVHKFASCDGCQLAFLNLGEDLLTLSQMVDIVHFAEAGPVNPEAVVDIAFIEGSISTPEDIERIRRIRANARLLITLGACATAGGLQALRNFANADEWIASIYAKPEYIQSLKTSTPIAQHVKVDLEIWGCPVNGRQVMAAVRSLLSGVSPWMEKDKVCMECKRQHTVCVMVAKGIPCMGPVTRTGCGALCPGLGRDCYACYGPAENPNTASLAKRLEGIGLLPEAVDRRFRFITATAPAFAEAGLRGGKTSHD
ncbi:MAG: sulfhydrogenase subunit delta [Gammaproteobacteria bacterium]|nr:sulfhydrogenase subunit delta [Gammaproteobacteria bacterium]